MTRQDNIRRLLLLAGFVLCLLQVWLPGHYLTGDGPCHVANSKIIGDLWSNKYKGFYDHYYSLAYSASPNWLSHIVLAFLQLFLKGALAEKLFLSCYIFLFGGGFYLLLRRLGGNVYWPLIVFVFVFQFSLVMGFYNFSLSVGFFFLMILSWLSWLDNRKVPQVLAFFLFTVLAFFSHPISYLLGSLTCMSLTLSWVLAVKRREQRSYLTRNYVVLLLCLLPCALFFLKFMHSEGGAGDIHLQFGNGSFLSLLECKFLLSYASSELIFTVVTGIIISILFIIAVVSRCRISGVLKYDGFLVSFAIVLFIYLFFPGALLGGTYFNIRIALFVFILACCCIAYIPTFAGSIVKVGASSLYLISVCLCFIRLPCILSSDRGVAELLSVEKYIRPQSAVLPVFCRRNGVDERGHYFSDPVDIFAHAAQYLATDKPLIVLDNYEAHTNYFPLTWKAAVDPYVYLSTNEGIESLPPCADIEGYYRKSGVGVDYVVMWCYDSSFLTNDHFRLFFGQIQSRYHKIYTSAGGRVFLYERNNYNSTTSDSNGDRK